MNAEQLKQIAEWAYLYVVMIDHNICYEEELTPRQELHLLRKYRKWLIDSNRHTILTSQKNAALMLKATESTEALLKAVYEDVINA